MLCMNTPVYSRLVQLHFLMSEQQHSILVQLEWSSILLCLRSVDKHMKWEQEFVAIVWRTSVLLIKLWYQNI